MKYESYIRFEIVVHHTSSCQVFSNLFSELHINLFYYSVFILDFLTDILIGESCKYSEKDKNKI